MAGLLLRKSGPIPRPRGRSETGHNSYDPLTRWHRWRLPSSLPHIVFPHLRWPFLRTTIAGPMLRWSGPFLCPRRMREVTTPCKSTRYGVAWWCPATHTHTYTNSLVDGALKNSRAWLRLSKGCRRAHTYAHTPHAAYTHAHKHPRVCLHLSHTQIAFCLAINSYLRLWIYPKAVVCTVPPNRVHVRE